NGIAITTSTMASAPWFLRQERNFTADMCPVFINILNKYLFGSLPEYMESIAPFVTSDVMKTAAYELKGCVLKLSQEHSEAIGELMVISFINYYY
uniref:Secretoglobin family 1A member 1 n=1 Tax=Terrapene triunguis TaxID=2587831 RepID=A0A674JGP5_9SAUR